MLECGYGWVYLLKEDGDDSLCKIGVTKCDKVEDRIKKLQTGNGNKIRLVSSFLTNSIHIFLLSISFSFKLDIFGIQKIDFNIFF